jgi:hypothetical protein
MEWKILFSEILGLICKNLWIKDLMYTIRSEDNWNFSHPIRTRLTPHTGPTRHMFLKVDKLEGLWSTKKSQFRERFCKKHNSFVTHRTCTRPPIPVRPTWPSTRTRHLLLGGDGVVPFPDA